MFVADSCTMFAERGQKYCKFLLFLTTKHLLKISGWRQFSGCSPWLWPRGVMYAV